MLTATGTNGVTTLNASVVDGRRQTDSSSTVATSVGYLPKIASVGEETNSMQILSLKATNFKSYDSVEWRFGPNVAITGDNGQGKSSVPEAISYALWGCTLHGSPYTDHLIRKGAKEAEVTLEVEIEGTVHSIERVKGKKSELFLDRAKSSQSDLDKLLGEKERFLSVFVPGYFTSLSDKDARELLMRLIRLPKQEDVLTQLEAPYRSALEKEVLRDPEALAKEWRSEIKSCEAEYNRIEGRIGELKQRVAREVPADVVFPVEKSRQLEELKSQLAQLMTGNQTASAQLRLDQQNLRKQYELLKSHLKVTPGAPYHIDDECPVCARALDEEALAAALRHHESDVRAIEAQNEQTKGKLQDLINRGNELKTQIDALESQPVDQTESEALRTQIVALEAEESNARGHAAFVTRLRMEILDDKESLAKAEAELESLRAEQFALSEKVKAIGEYRAKLADMQVSQLKQYLNRVDLQLFEIAKTTGEVKPCFTVLYDGKEYKGLSYSEQVRANLEIASMLNNVLGLDYPVFVDNAESVTHFDEPVSSQLFTATVVKGKPLTVESDADVKGDVA